MVDVYHTAVFYGRLQCFMLNAVDVRHCTFLGRRRPDCAFLGRRRPNCTFLAGRPSTVHVDGRRESTCRRPAVLLFSSRPVFILTGKLITCRKEKSENKISSLGVSIVLLFWLVDVRGPHESSSSSSFIRHNS